MKSIFFQISLLLSIFTSAQEQPVQELTGAIYFDLDEASITPEARVYFRQEILNVIGYEEVFSVSLQGHTDGLAGDLYNQILSEARVDSVKSLFPSKVYRDELFTLKGFGKSKPVNPNDTEDGRSKNRRVDIVIKFRHILTIGEIDMLVDDHFENDTIIYGEKGTEIHIKAKTFYPHKIKDVDFDIKEVYTLQDMIRCGTVTMSSDGDCLETGGMIFSTATAGGEQINAQEEMLIRIPASEIDTSMKIYDIEVVDGDTLWKESEIPLSYNAESGFYEFKSRSMPNINIDKVSVVAAIASPITKFVDKLKDDNLTVKSRRYKYSKSYLVGSEKKMVLNGRVFKPKKAQFQPCTTDVNDMVISYAKKKDKTYFFAKPLGTLKYRRFFNRYIIKKKYYEQMTEKEIDERLDTIFSIL